MNHYSQISQERLKTCFSDLQILFNRIIRSYDCSILCGHRGETEQNEAFRQGYSKLQYPNSKHNIVPSLAVDVAPYEVTGIDTGKLQLAHFAGFVKGVAEEMLIEGLITHRIRCGVDWDSDNDVDDTKFWDACHFEIVPNG
jgi:peptidoglycan L-alanyl-D-glutamate endopeptidase CwlK